MTITKKDRSKYELLRERGDVPALMELTGLSRGSIYNVFNNGKCTAKVKNIFSSYYEAKAVEFEQANKTEA